MSEIRTNILISGESSEYRSNIEISIVTLNSALVDTHSSFRTNLDITTTLKDGSISAIKTNLELNNVALKFNLVDMTKLKQSLLYFSKFFNMYFEPEVMWDLLAQGTNEQINISHLNEALSNYVKIDTTNNILTDLERVKLNLQEHIKDNKKHLTEKEKEFLLNLMENPNSFGSGDSLFEKVSINQNNIILPAVKPLKQDGKDAGIISNTFISCRGIDSTASSGSGGITRIDLFNILSDEPINDSEFINNKFLKISPLIEDWIRHHLKEFETDPTVPDFIKKITEEQIKSWDAVASWFDISEDKSYIFTTNERGFVSHSFISCKGLDLNAASSGGSFSRSELFDILSENPQEGERINLKYLIGLEELVESFGFLKDINKNQVITALGYTPLKKEDFKDFATVSNIVKQDVDNWNFVFSLIGLSEDELYIFPKENRGFASDSFISCKGLDISANQIGGGISEDDFSTLLFNILTGNPTEGQFINLAFLDLSSYAQKDWINITYATKTSLEEKASKVITFDAGDGIIGGGTLESNRTFTLGIPSKITSITTNAVTSESHTHEIDQASTSVLGIVKLYDALDSDSTILALTAKQGKAIGTRVVALEDMWENKTTYLLTKNNRGIVSNSFISCRELDETAPQVGGTFDRSSLFEILSNEPQDGEFIDLRFLNLNDYVTIDYITSQGYITSNALSGYATQQWVLNKNYASQDDLTILREDFDNLNDVLNGNVGGVIDTWNEVVSFLDGYSQSDDLAAILSGMNTDIANRVLIEDFEKLEEAVNPLFGYFDANGNANNALKLGGHAADYFAPATAVNTLTTNLNSLTSRVSINEQGITTNKTNIATLVGQVKGLADDVEILKDYWYIDNDGNLHTTHNIVVDGGGAFGKGSGGGGDVPSGGGIDEAQLWNILGTSGTQTIHSSHIPDLSNKYLSVNGGTIENSSFGYHLSLIRPNSSKAVCIHFGNSIDGNLGYIGVGGSGNDFGIVPFYRDISNNYHTLLHSGNYSSYALPLSGGSFSGSDSITIDNNGNFKLNSRDVTYWHIDDTNSNQLLSVAASGTVTLGSNILTSSKVQVNSKGMYAFAVTGYSSSGTVIRFLSPNSIAAAGTTLDLGVASSTYNSGNIAFRYTAKDSKNNRISLGIYGVDDILSVTGRGNVLIGTTDDDGSYRVQVNGSIKADSLSNTDNSTGCYFGLRNQGLGVTDGGALVYSYGKTPISFYTNYLERMRIAGGGNVGVNTPNPAYLLDVNGTFNATTIYQNNKTLDNTYLSLAGGTITSDVAGASLIIDNTANLSYIYFKVKNTSKASVGWYNGAAYLANEATSNAPRLIVTDGGVPQYWDSYSGTNKYTLYHTGNFNPSDYLPKSGGTISGSTAYILSINRTSNNPVIAYYANSSLVGLLGISTTGSPIYVTNDGTTRDLIHSGNIGSQSVNYANSATTLTDYGSPSTDVFADYVAAYGSNGLSVLVNTSGAVVGNIGAYSTVLNIGDRASRFGRFIFARNDESDALYWQTVNAAQTNWARLRNIAFIDSNVASATKLQTGRYLWGNYFNGEGDVNGKPLFKVSSANTSINVDMASIIVGPVTSSRQGYSSGVGFNGLLGYGGYDNHLHGWIGLNGWYSGNEAESYALVFAVNDNTTYGSVLTERMRITPNGNVLIGKTSDNGYKLQVNGSVSLSGIQFDGGESIDTYGNFTFASGSGYWHINNSDASLLFSVWRATGNVQISNSTSDFGYKLYVGGTGYFGGVLSVNGGVSITAGNIDLGKNEIANAKAIHCHDSGTGYYVGGRNYGLGTTNGGALVYAYGATPISFYTNGKERMIITDSGNISIGAASNGYKFYLKDTTTNSNAIYLETTNTSGEASIFYKAGNTGYQWAVGIACGLAGKNVLSMYSVSAGKWIFAAKATGVDINGNLTVTGGGAFGSDIRYKDITSYRQLDLETIANAPLFSFRWTDREDKVEHLGTSAQYWLDTQFKDAVNITNPKFFHLDYGALAVGIGISVAREVKGVKTEVEVLRERVNQLEKELAQYRRA